MPSSRPSARARGLLGPPARVVEPVEGARERGRVVAAVVLGARRAWCRASGRRSRSCAGAARPGRGRGARASSAIGPLDREAHERLADAAVGPARALVGEHRPRLVAHRGDAVAVGDVAELDQVVLGRGERFLPSSATSRTSSASRCRRARYGELDVHDAVAGVHERGEVLDAVLDPLHRPAGWHARAARRSAR